MDLFLVTMQVLGEPFNLETHLSSEDRLESPPYCLLTFSKTCGVSSTSSFFFLNKYNLYYFSSFCLFILSGRVFGFFLPTLLVSSYV